MPFGNSKFGIILKEKIKIGDGVVLKNKMKAMDGNPYFLCYLHLIGAVLQQ